MDEERKEGIPLMRWIVGIAAILVVGFFLYSLARPAQENTSPQPVPVPTAPVPAPSPSPSPSSATSRTITIEMTSGGFSPAAVAISRGATVRFVNRDSIPHWPASDLHPTHLLCPGFDSEQGVPPGASYEHVFAEVQTCPMHDHLHPSLTGTITVQ